MAAFLGWARDDAGRRSEFAKDRLLRLLDGRADRARRLRSWGGHGRHWLLAGSQEE